MPRPFQRTEVIAPREYACLETAWYVFLTDKEAETLVTQRDDRCALCGHLTLFHDQGCCAVNGCYCCDIYDTAVERIQEGDEAQKVQQWLRVVDPKTAQEQEGGG